MRMITKIWQADTHPEFNVHVQGSEFPVQSPDADARHWTDLRRASRGTGTRRNRDKVNGNADAHLRDERGFRVSSSFVLRSVDTLTVPLARTVIYQCLSEWAVAQSPSGVA